MSKLKTNGSIILIALAFVGGSFLQKMLPIQSALAQQANKENPSSVKWEYAIVYGLNSGKNGAEVTICYFQADGCQPETVELQRGNNRDVLAIAVAKLGQEGWEMMGEGKNLSESSSWIGSLYFKRQKR